MSRIERGSNSLRFTGEEHCSIERPMDARRTSQGVGYSFASVWGVHTADSTQYDLLKENAQANRKNPTEAESILWDMLKGNNIGLHFRRQHIILDYIVDFICIEKGLVIELDGGYHNDPEQAEYDKQRTAHLEKLGYTELRFTNEELLINPDAVIAQIKEVAFSLPSLQGRAGERHLLPSLQGRGGDRLLLRGVCVGYVTKEKNPIKQYFTRRAIIIGGPALADDATDEEVVALLEAVKEKASLQLSPVGKRDTAQEPSHLGCFKGRLCSLLSGRDGVGSPIYIETRNFNDYSRWKGAFEKAGFEYKRHLNFHVDCTDKEQMWERLSENRKRQVRHANGDFKFKTSNLRFDNLPVTEQDVREWYEILSELYRKKVKTPLWPVEFFIEAYRQGIGQFMLVRHEGKIIGGSMVVRWKPIPDNVLRTATGSPIEQCSSSLKGRDVRGTVYEWFECGLNAQYKEQYPSVMATYAGMCYAADEGIGRYDMMGAGVPDVPYGVRDFKAEFGGQLVEHGRFVCVRKPLLYKIGTMAVKMMKGT